AFLLNCQDSPYCQGCGFSTACATSMAPTGTFQRSDGRCPPPLPGAPVAISPSTLPAAVAAPRDSFSPTTIQAAPSTHASSAASAPENPDMSGKKRRMCDNGV